MIDTHAHVQDRAFDGDRPEMLERARAAGVNRIVTIGCDLEDSARALEAAERYGLFASAGVHPHEAAAAPPDVADRLRALVRRGGSRVVALGETGFDFYYLHSPRDAQKAVLEAHIELAKELGLPLVFHVRDAFDDFVAVLRERFEPPLRGVVHCFTGDAREANTYVEEFGLFLGIGGVLTFKSAEPLRDAVRAVGLDAIVLETDCPYLAPVPHRGKRNEPAYVARTAEALAALLGRCSAEIAAATKRNASRLFGFSPAPYPPDRPGPA
jgi:TatD DNase family protein